MSKLSLDLVTSQVATKQKGMLTKEVIEEIDKLSEDPDYGQEFLDTYIDHLNVFKENTRANHDMYLNAVKFFSLVEAGNNLTDAYIKVFPERFERRSSSIPDESKKKEVMRGEASRYNSTKMVNEIRKVAAIPVQLIHRHLLHEMILGQAELARNARSELVRQKAGATLIAELKPSEENVLNVVVDDGSKSAIEELRLATRKLAIAQKESVDAGIPMKEIAEANVYEAEVEVVEDTADGS